MIKRVSSTGSAVLAPFPWLNCGLAKPEEGNLGLRKLLFPEDLIWLLNSMPLGFANLSLKQII